MCAMERSALCEREGGGERDTKFKGNERVMGCVGSTNVHVRADSGRCCGERCHRQKKRRRQSATRECQDTQTRLTWRQLDRDGHAGLAGCEGLQALELRLEERRRHKVALSRLEPREDEVKRALHCGAAGGWG